jgi:hypothetical protein
MQIIGANIGQAGELDLNIWNPRVYFYPSQYYHLLRARRAEP